MNSKQQTQQTGIMKAANSAATKVSGWSDAKKNYAAKVVSSGSFQSKGASPIVKKGK